jgi:hypothetical protein
MPYLDTSFSNVVIFDELLYRPTHLVHHWMTKVTMRFEAEAINAAPVDTGVLVAGISGSVKTLGPRLLQGTISSEAPYTMYVIRGTGFPVKGHEGRIYTTKGFITRNPDDAYVMLWGTQSRANGGKFNRKGRGDGTYAGRRRQIQVRKRGYWLKLPFGTAQKPMLKFSVRGQEPNNFLFTAWNRTAYTHSAIRRHGAQFPGELR